MGFKVEDVSTWPEGLRSLEGVTEAVKKISMSGPKSAKGEAAASSSTAKKKGRLPAQSPSRRMWTAIKLTLQGTVQTSHIQCHVLSMCSYCEVFPFRIRGRQVRGDPRPRWQVVGFPIPIQDGVLPNIPVRACRCVVHYNSAPDQNFVNCSIGENGADDFSFAIKPGSKVAIMYRKLWGMAEARRLGAESVAVENIGEAAQDVWTLPVKLVKPAEVSSANVALCGAGNGELLSNIWHRS